MSILLNIILCIVILMVINVNLIKLYLDEKTRYKCDIYDQPNILFLYMFFGVFILPFMKYMKRYRKILYLKKRLDQLKSNKIFTLFQEPEMRIIDIEKEIFDIERFLKLNKLKRKTNEIF